MNIYLYHPSRGRPEKAQATYKKWLELAGEVSAEVSADFYHRLSLDVDDKDLPKYSWYSDPIINDNDTMVQALNACSRPEDDGIVITLYDDMLPNYGWAEDLIEAYQPGKLLRIRCGVPLQTVCAGCASVFHRWGYVYYPSYLSMYADNDYQEHGEREGLFVDCNMSVKHYHPAHGNGESDATYARQNHSAAYRIGKQVLDRRRWTEFSF